MVDYSESHDESALLTEYVDTQVVPPFMNSSPNDSLLRRLLRQRKDSPTYSASHGGHGAAPSGGGHGGGAAAVSSSSIIVRDRSTGAASVSALSPRVVNN